jgi:hypothetical protein
MTAGDPANFDTVGGHFSGCALSRLRFADRRYS